MLFETLLCQSAHLLLNVRGHPWVNPVLCILLTLLELVDKVILQLTLRLRVVDLAGDERVRDCSCSEKLEDSIRKITSQLDGIKLVFGTYFLQASGLEMLPSIISVLPCSFSIALISVVIFLISNWCIVVVRIIYCPLFLSRSSASESEVSPLRRRMVVFRF